jgi:hypothetical protein
MKRLLLAGVASLALTSTVQAQAVPIPNFVVPAPDKTAEHQAIQDLRTLGIIPAQPPVLEVVVVEQKNPLIAHKGWGGPAKVP